MNRNVFAAIAALLALAPMALADQLILKNGDRLTGSIVKADDKTLTIKTDLAGTVSVPVEAITQISSSQPLFLTLADNQVLVGSVATAEDKLAVTTADAGIVTVARGAVVGVRSKEEQEAYQRQQDRLNNPRLSDLWSGTVDTGLSMSRGNADTTTFTFGANATRATKRDKLSAYMLALYARNTTEGVSQVTANAKRGGARYDINLTPKLFAFGMGSLENDEFQKLDLRLGLGGGLGWHARKTERTTLEVFFGDALNKEYFTDLNQTSGKALIKEELSWKMSSRFSIRERATILPNLTETGEYRFNFDTTAVTAMSSWLSWTVSISDRYLSNPVPDTKSNDFLFTTGFRLTFGVKQ